MKSTHYLTAAEVAEALKVSPTTVYAYVSRGLLRSEPAGANNRARLYNAEDVQKLVERKTYRRDPAKATSDAMHWGMPILSSELTLIDETGIYYRGYDVTQLATSWSFERVAALLWTGEPDKETSIFSPNQSAKSYHEQLKQITYELTPLQKLQIVLTLAAADDLAAYDLDPQLNNILRSGARILRLVAATLADSYDLGLTSIEILRQGWGQQNLPHFPSLLNAALILSADHELNTSAFTARVVASAATPLYQVIIAGLAALQGFKHGGNTLLVEELLYEVSSPERAYQAVASRLQRGGHIPGFGHQLYPSGDPRGALLLRLIAQAYATTPSVQHANAIVQTVEQTIHKKPNLDFSLALLARVLQLPRGSALAIFALGRTVGWIAHAIEQYKTGQLIRPRATYTGPR
ncbi:citrate synthase family protein [Ktedonosporobacter rubrisoli]|nr:citrate synthase family protein [Ktedonosporobacter rubrisoli]